MVKKLVLTNRLWIVLLVGLCANLYQAFPILAAITATPAPIVTVQSHARVGEQVTLVVDFYGHSVYVASSYGWVVYSKPDWCTTNQFGALDCRSETVSQKSLTFVIGFQSTGTHQLNITNYAIESGPNNGIAREVYVNPALTPTPTLTATPTSTPTATPTVTSTNVPQPVCFIDVLYGQNYAAVTYISNLDVQKSEIRNSSGQVVFTGNAANANTPTSLFHFNPTVGVEYTVWTQTLAPQVWNACTPSYTRGAATPTPSVTPTLTATPTPTATAADTTVHCNFVSITWNVNMKVNVAVSFDQPIEGWGWYNADHSIHVSYSGQTPENEIISFESDYRYGEVYKFGVIFDNEDQICGTFPAPQAPTPSSTPTLGLTPGTPVPASTPTATSTSTPTPTLNATATLFLQPSPTTTSTATVVSQPTPFFAVGIVNGNLSLQSQSVQITMIVTDATTSGNNLLTNVDGVTDQQFLYSPPAGSNQVIVVHIDPQNANGMKEDRIYYVVNGVVQLTPPQGPRIFLPLINR